MVRKAGEVWERLWMVEKSCGRLRKVGDSCGCLGMDEEGWEWLGKV